MAPTQTFARFPELPTEIRKLVWGFAVHLPREVEIIVKPKTTIAVTFSFNPPILDVTYSFISPNPVPAILHICFEAREEGLKVYQLSDLDLNRCRPRDAVVPLRAKTLMPSSNTGTGTANNTDTGVDVVGPLLASEIAALSIIIKRGFYFNPALDSCCFRLEQTATATDTTEMRPLIDHRLLETIFNQVAKQEFQRIRVDLAGMGGKARLRENIMTLMAGAMSRACYFAFQIEEVVICDSDGGREVVESMRLEVETTIMQCRESWVEIAMAERRATMNRDPLTEKRKPEFRVLELD